MSITGLTQASRTATINSDDYDHAISLVDTTKPVTESVQDRENSDEPESGGASLSRKWTKSTLREEIVRRKYAKWQEDRQTDGSNGGRTGAESSDPGEQTDGVKGKQPEGASGRTSRLRDKVPFRSRKKSTKAKEEEDYAIDILYENQRGAFWCGIPLYSAKSLLNFDPAGWQSSSFHDSPVNITNAQVPDPTWRWAWRTWYVDMSHDVDEEGWEYSFSFQPNFAWHGSHPWFHSFVRRRRWLRKRIKVHLLRGAKSDDMKAAHMLTAEYFTIHPKRDISPDSTGLRTSIDKSTYHTVTTDELEDDEGFSEITDVNALMAALRKARLDREKVAAITNFLEHGGDELHYLAERMLDIMAIFIYQTSRRQVHSLLLEALDKATAAIDDSKNGQDEEDEARVRKKDSLLKAVQAAGVHINDQDYWSDLREKTTDDEPPDAPIERTTLDATQPSGEPGQGPKIDDGAETDIKHEIKGIPDDANVSEEPGIQWRKASDLGPLDKGKDKA